jgi:hypothetical protein
VDWGGRDRFLGPFFFWEGGERGDIGIVGMGEGRGTRAEVLVALKEFLREAEPSQMQTGVRL